MSKLAVYISILATVLLGFHMFGIIENTTLLGYLVEPEQFFELEFYANILSSIVGVITTGIVIGSLWTGRTDIAISALMANFLLSMGQDLLAVYNVVKLTLPDLALILIGPLFLVYSLTIFEWLRGVSQ